MWVNSDFITIAIRIFINKLHPLRIDFKISIDIIIIVFKLLEKLKGVYNNERQK